MSNTKISALTSATTPLAGTETLPIVQGGAPTKQVSVANLTAGRSVSMADATLSTGNLVQGTAAKGINFTANTPAAGKTSQLLNWYEEGTFTPTLLFGGGNTGQTGSYLGTYTRIGRIVTFAVNIGITTIGSSTGTTTITGLPFTTAAYPNPSVSLFAQYDGQIINIFAYLPASSSTLTLYNTTTGAAITQLNFTAGTSFIRVTGSYTV